MPLTCNYNWKGLIKWVIIPPPLYLNLYYIFRDYYFTFNLTQAVFIDIIYRIDHKKTYNYSAPTLVPILTKSRQKCVITRFNVACEQQTHFRSSLLSLPKRGEFYISHDASRLISVFSPGGKSVRGCRGRFSTTWISRCSSPNVIIKNVK